MPKHGYKQTAEHIAARVLTRFPSGPKVTAIVCRFCGSPREVPSKSAARYSTCGLAECTARRRQEAGAAKKGAGEANPRYSTGQWVTVKKLCAVCGNPFAGPSRRRYCSTACSALGRSATLTGKPLSEERKARMRGKSGTGPKSEAWKDAMSERLRAESNPNWLEGRRADMDRATRRYSVWRTGVLERDDHTCQTCGGIENVIAHHIKEWRPYPELRYVISNGLALCVSCHVRLHRGRFSLLI